ncbi:MAG TPA: hypothetical protein PKY41_06000, partial [Bacteroidales bacterium]|nr:hypothetical protein [Bacteroidales bacterium]
GATGDKGDKGDTGNVGATGATGNNGIDGATGATGATGNNGIDGATGATGNNGVDGATGATGATGDKGDKGDTGNVGATGATGETGAQGITGATGATGSVASLTDSHILVGNSSNLPTDVAMSGDVTINNSGVTAIGAGKVTNAMLAGSIDLTTKVTNILPITNGGTALGTTPNNGELLIGNGTNYSLSTLTGTSNQVSVANGSGTIQLSLPQNIHTGASPSFTGLNLSGLAASSGIYTDASKNLTSTAPTSGILGYWSRTGTTLSTANSGDEITTSGNISTSGTGTITSAGLLTASKGFTATGADISLNVSSNFNTNINTGTSTGNVTIGNSLNNINFPKLNASSVVLTDASKNLTSIATLSIANGGTNSTANPTNGGIAYGNGSAYNFSAAGSTGQILQSAGASSPTWSTATYPATAGTKGNLLVSDGTNFVSTPLLLSASAALDFPKTDKLSSSDLTITVTGATVGDVVAIGVPNSAAIANTCYTAWVSAANTVTVRFNNYNNNTAQDPAYDTFKVTIIK